MTLNSGESVSAQLGAFTHFGSDEKVAGEAVGTRLASDGVTHPICVIHEQGNVSLEARCAGMQSKVPGSEILYVTGTDMTQGSSTVTAKLQSTAGVDAVKMAGGAELDQMGGHTDLLHDVENELSTIRRP